MGCMNAPKYRPVNHDRPLSLRSKVTNGRAVFCIGGDGNSVWTRRWKDLVDMHVSDRGGFDICSEGELAIVRITATLEVEMERLAAKMSEGKAEPEDVDRYNRLAGNVRRNHEALGLKRAQKPVNAVEDLGAIWLEACSWLDENPYKLCPQTDWPSL
jgi:hypothetical protein